MTAPVAVSERDLRTLLGIVSDGRTDLPADGLPPSLLTDLMSLIRCDAVTFTGVDSGRQQEWFSQDVPPAGVGAAADDGQRAVDQQHWDHYWDFAPACYPDRTGDLRAILKISDFYSARQWHSSGTYGDHYRPAGLEHELQLCLPAERGPAAGPGRTVRLFFTRGPGPDFSERDRALLTLLRPHLHHAYLDAERRRRPVPRLTPRHWELLRLLAAGHTNTQIARRLGISEGTVRAHLENIYGRLQVSSRAAAVTRAFPDWAA
jgi:DNA-binding CsgD family transcriptional regulator